MIAATGNTGSPPPEGKNCSLLSADRSKTGSVVLRGVTVDLDSDIGQIFIADCCRNLEGQMSDAEIKTKYELTDGDWERLADNSPLLRAVRAERERRILSGEAAKEAAQRHLTKAPGILNGILVNEQISPRHRIEAARELRQAASTGPEVSAEPREKFVITINLGDEVQVFEKEISPQGALPPDDGEVP